MRARPIRTRELVASLLCIVAVGACIVFVIQGEHFINYWDFGAYWYKTLGVIDGLQQQPKQALIDVYHTINTDKYNDLLSFVRGSLFRQVQRRHPSKEFRQAGLVV